MKFSLLLSVLALACSSSSPKPATPAEPPPVASAPPAEPAPAAKPAPAPELPPIPDAGPPVKAGPPRPHVPRALAFLPPDAHAVVGIDVPRIAGTPLGDKIRQAYLSGKVPPVCLALTAAQFGNAVIGVSGGGKVVIVVDGKLPERGMVSCLEAAEKAKGAKVEVKTVGGRTFHYITGSPHDDGWIAWTKTAIVAASSEAALSEALDTKASKLTGDLASLSLQVDHGHMVWAAGIVPAAALAGLGLSADVVGGPVTVRASIDVVNDTDIDVVLGGASPAAATAMANALRQLVGQLRSAPEWAPLVAGFKLGVHGSELHATARFDAELTRKLLDATNLK